MKTLKNMLLIAVLFMAVNVSAQTDKATTTRLVEAKTFIFNATSAQPMNSAEINAVLTRLPGSVGAGVVPLRGDIYQLTVASDNVDAYLPYYGRSYMAPKNPTEGGIKFNTKEFSYKADKKKKGNYIVTIKPVDSKADVLSMILNITEKGYASLSVISNNRQTINYSGFISDPAKLAAK
ncbi:MAG: DUF4251 domain-containing protein [Pedobacter sp.]|nr:MAG: DUF4251 domain-containing protein [Pedobacter sp.]